MWCKILKQVHPFDIAQAIVYEDNHFLIVNKPSGILVQGDHTGDKPLSELAKDFLKVRDHKPGNVFCGVTHRIDRPVSGLVVLAKTSKGLSKMNELFREDGLSKTYMALINGCPEQSSATLIHYLRKNAKTLKADVFEKPVANAKLSELRYEVVEQRMHQTLIKVWPISGRFHQIRAQLSAIGFPIVGDIKYGAPQALKNKSIALHAHALNFTHPIKMTPLEVHCDPPF